MDVKGLGSRMSEADLRERSKGFGSLIPKKGDNLDEEAFQNLKLSFRKVIHTANSANLSPTHGAAAWNFIYGFLEQGISCSDQRLRNFCFASQTWVEVYELFLARSQNNKSKPVKQMLLTLTKVLTRNPVDSVQQFLVKYVISTAVLAICDHDDFPSVKPAFQVLEHFIDQKIVHASEIIFQLAQKSSFQEETILPNLAIENLNLQGPSSIPQHLQVSAIRKFVTNILGWVRYPDVAPIGGRLVVTFFKSLQTLHFEFGLPLWVKPVIDLLELEPSLFEIFELHVLSELLRLNVGRDHQPFLNTNLLQDLRDGNSAKHSDVEIQLCLLALRVGIEMDASKKPGNDLYKLEYDIEYESQEIALALMGHSSASIRITALSLIAHHPTPTEPFSSLVLECLEQFVPYFHLEVNPRVRNEFIGIMKRICIRLERGFSFISKNNTSNKSQPTPNVASEASATEDLGLKDFPSKKHLRFSKFYIRFLIHELQPTASYQRHITALKILEFMIVEGLTRSDPSRLFHPSKIIDVGFIRGEKQEQFFNSLSVQLILDLVMDPFDDVRLISSKLLQLVLWNQYPQTASSWTKETDQFIDPSIDYLRTLSRRSYHIFISHALCRAESIMYRTGRAHHADGVGKLYYLLHDSCQNFSDITIKNVKMPMAWSTTGWSIIDHILSELRENINITRQDIRSAVGSTPLHGALISLRNIIGYSGFYDLHSTADPDWKLRRSLNDRILACCTEVWEVLKGVLCYDSPEGYTLEDEENKDLDTGTKDMLSFSWRALKESSTLMNLMVTIIPYSSDSDLGLHYSDLQKIGDLAFSQLTQLRHRGAFSTVSQTFSSSCKRCVEVDHQILLARNLPQKWYQEVLKIIERNADTLTRRSAGLPSIVVGILSAIPEGDFFNHIISSLQTIANSPIESRANQGNPRLPQVHALNCLKDLFLDTRLGPSTELHMADTLNITAGCLESDLWAIRNCGLMLFKAIITRLNGGTDAASTKVSSSRRRFSRLAYEQYPNLPNIVYRLIKRVNPTNEKDIQLTKEAPHSQQAQRVFLALEIIGRSGLPPEYRSTIQDIIREQMEGPNWAIRDKAARTLSLLIVEKDFTIELKNLLYSNWKTHNVLHGRLLCAQYLVSQKRQQSKDDLEPLLPLFVNSFDGFITRNNCPFTAAAYLDFISKVLILLLKHDYNSRMQFVNMIIDCIKTSGVESKRTSKDHSFALLEEALKRCWESIYQNSISRSSMANNISPRAPKIWNNPENRIELFSRLKCYEAALTSQSSSSLDQTSISESVADLSGDSEQEDNLRKWILQRHSTQENSDDLLGSGVLLGVDFFKQIRTREGQEFFTTWICKLSLAMDERAELSTRLAVLDSVSGFFHVLEDRALIKPYTHVLLGIFLVLYDALLDDDEEVRNKAAATTSILLRKVINVEGIRPMASLSPAVAAQRLIQFMTFEFSDSKLLIAEATYRLIGMSSLFKLGQVNAAIPEEFSRTNHPASSQDSEVDRVPFVPFRSVDDMLDEVAEQNDLLFVEEKQNLFIDPAREADNWAEVLMEANPFMRTASMMYSFEAWTIRGLEALTNAIRDEENGPPGWASKPDVFTLGVRIILAAKVQLHWTNYMPRREACSSNIRELLSELRACVDGLWLERITEILQECS